MGPQLTKLEENLANYYSVPNTLGVPETERNRCAYSLLWPSISNRMMRLSPRLLRFIATAETIALLKAKPAFADIDEATENIDPKLIEAKSIS